MPAIAIERVRGARAAVAAVFLLNGIVFGTWASRIPAIRDRAGLTQGELGIALAAIAAGAIAAMPLAGAWAVRAGSRRATRASFLAACLIAAVVPLATSLPSLCALTFALGVAMGATDVTMNAHGVTVEHRFGRPILAGFHAAFSLGGLAGAALGAAIAAAEIDVRAHLAAVALTCALVGGLWSRHLLAADADAATGGEPTFARPPRRLWALGGLAFACLLIEGASADWSAVYLRDELDTGAGTAALGFTAFSITMTAGRLIGDRLVGRFGATAVVRTGGSLAAVGFSLALAAAHPVAAIVGFACLGAGMAGIVPIVFRAAGAVDGLGAGVALAAVASTGYLGFVVGPPVIGGLAELVGLPTGLIAVVVLAAVVAALAPTTRLGDGSLVATRAGGSERIAA